MKKNMGTTDKVIRILVAIAITVLLMTKVFTGTLGIIMFALAIVFLVTSYFGVCPVYTLFRINTLGKQKNNTSAEA
ncbi:MAG: DUF2892 domain-containing protein [Bacteroidota bacterium]|nr:DUF2892 domain-containing protein [Bacteroidota bacterium]